MNRTGIEYLDLTWNPIVMRCDRVSEGCKHCWHLEVSNRHALNPRLSKNRRSASEGGTPVFLMHKLTEPIRRRAPSVVGVQFMGDLFHSRIPRNWIESVLAAMAASYAMRKGHVFLVLTKRVGRMVPYATDQESCSRIHVIAADICARAGLVFPGLGPDWWPLPNVLWGVTVENRLRAEERIGELLRIPGRRWLSVEPMLGPVSLPSVVDGWGMPGTVEFVVAGCEKPARRHTETEWVRDLRDQCMAAGVRFFLKQMNDRHRGIVSLPELDGRRWSTKPSFVPEGFGDAVAKPW